MSHSSSVFSVSQISFNLGFQMFYLLKDNYLLCFISLFFSSIVLMLAHVFSALMELGYVNHDFFFLNALTKHSCEHCVCVCVGLLTSSLSLLTVELPSLSAHVYRTTGACQS